MHASGPSSPAPSPHIHPPTTPTTRPTHTLSHPPTPPQPFFEYMFRALAPGGIVCTQGESQWFHMDIIKELAAM